MPALLNAMFHIHRSQEQAVVHGHGGFEAPQPMVFTICCAGDLNICVSLTRVGTEENALLTIFIFFLVELLTVFL